MTEHANGTPKPIEWNPPPLLVRGTPWVLGTFGGNFSAIAGMTFSENIIPSQFVVADVLLRQDAQRGLTNHQARFDHVLGMAKHAAGVDELVAPDEWADVREGQPWVLVAFGGFGGAIACTWYSANMVPEQVVILAKVCGLEADRLLQDMKAQQDDAAPRIVPAHRLPPRH